MIRVVAFDGYGTLFDVDAAARRLAAEPGREGFGAVAALVSRDWRFKQLQYSWIRAITGVHADFWTCTEDGLDWALEAAGVGGEGLRSRLLALYAELDAYPEVPATLSALKARGLATAILSNGSPAMLDGAVRSAGIGGLLDAVLSVEAVGVFKPAPAVYGMVGTRFGTAPEEVLFVSSNGWDAASAAGFGFETVWANRAGAPVERLPWRPRHILPDLSAHPGAAAMNRFVTPDGLALAWEEEGAGLPLLCLPGLTRNGADFDELGAALGGRHRLIRLTLRGRGASDRDPDFRQLQRRGRGARRGGVPRPSRARRGSSSSAPRAAG